MSALYTGTLRHRRFGPGPEHDFAYRVSMPLFDVEEVDGLAAKHRLWSASRRAPGEFRRSDFLGDPTVPLRQEVLDLVELRSAARPAGAVSLLANVRTWGWLFNPISLYFCAGADGSTEALVAEVENTPWHTRVSYVVGPPGGHRFPKAMHVSPFMPMDVDYVLSYSDPGQSLSVSLDVVRGDERLLAVTLGLRRRPLDRRALRQLLFSPPAAGHRVSAGIYTQAARLKLKRAPVFRHPSDGPTRAEPARAEPSPLRCERLDRSHHLVGPAAGEDVGPEPCCLVRSGDRRPTEQDGSAR